MLAELGIYSRLAWGIAQTQRMPLPAEAVEVLKERLARREETFLRLVERAVFQNPANPYAEMFRLAGCSYGDLASAVGRDGLDATLVRLRREGVYLTHEESKGRRKIVRGGREIAASVDGIRNPYGRGLFESSSSGSSGPPVRIQSSLQARVRGALCQMVRAREFGTPGSAWVHLRPILPNQVGMMLAIQARRLGMPVDRWFSQDSRQPTFAAYKLLTRAMLAWANLLGAGCVYPEFLPPNEFLPVAQRLARLKAEGRHCLVQGTASPLVRVAGAALEHGLDISASTFICGGEALTQGKIAIFERAGVRPYANYAMNELGLVGMACRQCSGNTVHLLAEATAAIVVRRPSPYDESVEVDSLHLTSLTPYSALILINFEADDEAELIPASCDCVYSRIGYRTLITNISSFGKASPQGMTFHAVELQHVLEEQMPARLGGGPGDYQLVECEGADGQSQLRLYASPRTGVTDKARAAKVFLELMRPRWGGAVATRAWDHSGAIEVVLAEPHATVTGKVHAVRLLPSGRLPRPEAGLSQGGARG